MNVRGVSFGGKGSTQLVVQGSHKEFPQELLEDLKNICQVQNLRLSEYLIKFEPKERRFRNAWSGSNSFTNYI